MNTRQFKSKAEAMFRKVNPAVAATVAIAWVSAGRVTYPTGLKGMAGRFRATAPGYKSRVMMADYDATTGFMVR